MHRITAMASMLMRYVHTSERQQAHAGTTDAIISTALNAAACLS